MKKGLLLFAAGLFNLAAITAQVQPVQPKLTDDKSFSMILFPDPQSYTKFDVNQPLFELMTAWHRQQQRETEYRSCALYRRFGGAERKPYPRRSERKPDQRRTMESCFASLCPTG